MTGRRLKTFWAPAALLVTLVLAREPALADPVACLPGKNCELTHVQKIRRSVKEAVFVAQGRFELTPRGVPNEVLSDHAAFLDVTFRVDRILKGRVATKLIQLQWKVFTAPAPKPSRSKCEPCGGAHPLESDASALVEALTSLERSVEEGTLSREDYRKELVEAR